MKSIVQSSKITGTMMAPASKSFAQRAIFAALLAPDTSYLHHWSWSDDSLHAYHAAISLGAKIKYYEGILEVKGSIDPISSQIYVGESGLSGRILSSILMLYQNEMTIHGSGSLLNRPFSSILPVYRQLGVSGSTKTGLLPIRIEGPIHSNDIFIDGSQTSQFVTGLMIALPKAKFKHAIHVQNPNSRPYIEMTIEMLKEFGVIWKEVAANVFQLESISEYRSCNYTIEGDWSGAAFLIGASLISGDLEIQGLDMQSSQADRAILNLFNSALNVEDGSIRVKQTKIPGFKFNATQCPDLFPPLVAIASYADSKSIITGVSRLKQKESDRAKALVMEFKKIGIEIEILDDKMIITPGIVRGGEVFSHNDHRIAMSLSIAGLGSQEEVSIQGAESVSKSYPSFYHDLQQAGANIQLVYSSI